VGVTSGTPAQSHAIISAADEAVYAAKRAGGDRVTAVALGAGVAA
jgi:PleD family two-component response regulator